MNELKGRDWLLASLLAFGIGCGLSAATGRSLRDALATGAIAIPASWPAAWLAERTTGQAPRRRQRRTEGSSETAIFWDYENVKDSARHMTGTNAPLAELIVDYSRSQGHLRVKTVYANWRRENEVVAQTLYSMGFEPIHVSLKKANSVDVKLTVDCLNTAYQYPEIEHFLIVTADKDFIPLVNALRALEKRVTLIGRAETASDQLILSADEFISLEELLASKLAAAPPTAQPPDSISYATALDCLIAAIDAAQNCGRSTRFPSIDVLMRANCDYSYQGATAIQKPDGSGPFASFSAFATAAALDGKVLIREVDGFKELFLPEDEATPTEAEAVPEDAGIIDREAWQIILERIQKAFAEGHPGPTYGRFKILLGYVRQAGREGLIPNNYGVLRNALSQLASAGILVRQDDGSYRLVEDWEARREEYLDELS